MISGAKGRIKAKEIRQLYVPQYEALSREKILIWAVEHQDQIVQRYLPIQKEWIQLHRQCKSEHLLICQSSTYS